MLKEMQPKEREFHCREMLGKHIAGPLDEVDVFLSKKQANKQMQKAFIQSRITGQGESSFSGHPSQNNTFESDSPEKETVPSLARFLGERQIK